MTRNKNWNLQWKDYVNGLYGLGFIPNTTDSLRLRHICVELKEIIDRNTEQG